MNKATSFGLLLIDKPPKLTSHDVVAAIRKWLGLKAVGHAGTLDPMATGLLIILLGQATKLSAYLKTADKSYAGTISLGVATDTYDAEGKVVLKKPCHVSPAQVKEAAASFIPGYLQTPPDYAALKIKGQAAYRLARKGKQVELPPREVKIYRFEAELVEPEKIKFNVSCSTGTYMRSLAVDLANKLGCVGHLSSLRRTKVGSFNLKNALTLEQFKNAVASKKWQRYLIPALEAVNWPLVVVKESSLRKVKNGQLVGVDDFLSINKEGDIKENQLVKVADQVKNFIAIGLAVNVKPLKVKPKKVFLS